MTTPKKSIFKRLKESQWFMTLTSTTIGVLLGLYLTNYSADKSLKNGKEKAIQQITNELNDNEKELRKYNKALASNYNAITYVFSKLNTNFEIVISKDSLDAFKNNSKDFFDLQAIEKVNVNTIRLRGELNSQINSSLVVFKDLSDIVWKSYKQTDYMSITKFQCLTNLEGLYNFQNEVNKLNNEWTRYFSSKEINSEKELREAFLPRWKTLIEQQNLLLTFYEGKDKILKNCN